MQLKRRFRRVRWIKAKANSGLTGTKTLDNFSCNLVSNLKAANRKVWLHHPRRLVFQLVLPSLCRLHPGS